MDMEGLARTALRVLTVDAFTRVPFSGNPAAVVFLEDDADIGDETKQAIASEMKLSETAFVSKTRVQDDFTKSSRFKLRWFTPQNEVPLCGHATLATAAAIYDECGNSSEELVFDTRSGPLKAARGPDDMILLDLPARTTVPADRDKYGKLVEAVVGKLPVCELRYSVDEKKLLVRLDDHCTRAMLEQFRPSPAQMLQLETGGHVKGVTVTLRGDGEPYDFMSRHFCPWYGIPEDPVTGSAHTVLGPYWASALGKKELRARQASARGGDLYLKVQTSGERLQIGGHAVIVLRGELQL